MTRETKVQIVASIVLVGCLTASAALTPLIAASIGRNRLGYTDRAEEGQPPEVALGIAMGAFRGLFVNYLWMRANDLKEAGKYYESNELSQAITKLQPRFPRVWVFHAWNMAYNISVTTQTREERWEWVKRGIELLRDGGIPANPNDMLLHKELAWIFLHKIQGFTDDANQFYKRKLAEEWTYVLGPPPLPDPASRDRDTAIERYATWLGVVANAPDSFEDVVKAEPLAAELAQRLKQEVGEGLGFETLRRYALYQASMKSVLRATAERVQGPKSAAFGRLMAEPKYAKAWDAIIPHTRKRVLIDDYHMDPHLMVQYTHKYGPMDWRNGGAHAVYWSARGVEHSLHRWTAANKQDFDFINTDRITIQAIQELARSGDLYFNFFEFANGNSGFYLAMPNTHFIESYGNILQSLVERSWADTDKRPWSFYAAGYENFLKDYIRFYWRRGQKDRAEELYHRLRTFPGQNMNDPNRAKELSVPLSEWIPNELVEQHKTTYVMAQEVIGSLQGAYTTGLLSGDGELFRNQFEYAKQFHRYYMEEQLRVNPLNTTEGRVETLPKDFRQVAAMVLNNLLAVVEIDDAERIYDSAPNDLKQAAYDLIAARFKEMLDEQAKSGGEPFDKVFPEPAEMASYRKLLEQWQLEAQQREAAPRPSQK